MSLSLESGRTGLNALCTLVGACRGAGGEPRARGDLRGFGGYETVTGVTASPPGVIGLLPNGRLKFEKFPVPRGVVA